MYKGGLWQTQSAIYEVKPMSLSVKPTVDKINIFQEVKANFKEEFNNLFAESVVKYESESDEKTKFRFV